MIFKKGSVNSHKFFLIEDHHRALDIWRKSSLRNLNLVHLDAHVDFGFPYAKPLKQAFEEAKTVNELKQALEESLAFKRFENDFDKQTNIGNYIYPAVREGIVKDFYWVIPGGKKEFDESRKQLKTLIKSICVKDPCRKKTRPVKFRETKNLMSTSLMGSRFVVTNLENLPVFEDKVLLDIDCDFLVIDSFKNSDSTTLIGPRMPWIMPDDLVNILKKKVKNPQITTIAYSVNGGFTPIKYKYFGDEIAYLFEPRIFKSLFKKSKEAAQNFELFISGNKSSYYRKAARLNPAYKVSDNNYGNLYLAKNRLRKAEAEFKRISQVDPSNPFPLAGLGSIFLQKKNYGLANKYFSRALKNNGYNNASAIFGLALSEFKLGNLDTAEKVFLKAKSKDPLNGQIYYFLGCIYEKFSDFESAAKFYRQSLNLGLKDIDIFRRILRISRKVNSANNLIKFALNRLGNFKQELQRAFKKSQKKKSEIRKLMNLIKRITVIESLLKNESC